MGPPVHSGGSGGVVGAHLYVVEACLTLREAGLPGKDPGQGHILAHIPPKEGAYREKVQLLSGQVSHDGRTRHLLPPRLGLVVPHDEVIVEQLHGNAEQQGLPGNPPVKGKHRIAQRTEGHQHRNTGNLVVDHLVVHQDPQGVHVDLAVQCQHAGKVVVIEPGVR